MEELKKRHCVPCEGGVPKMSREKAKEWLSHLKGWKLVGDKIQKSFLFKNFMHAIGFVNEISVIAENEGHHPDFSVHYNKVDVTLSTHAIKGLSENDFILAAKLDDILA